MLIRAAASIATLLELDQATIAAGEDVDDDPILRRTASLVNVLRNLGLNKMAPNISSSKPALDGNTHALQVEP